jgi:Zn finger protein HypA/HybF involved in hydrogenase expression
VRTCAPDSADQLLVCLTSVCFDLALESSMGEETNIVRLLDRAPRVTCQRCSVEMTIRAFDRVPETNEYTVTYRCPKCGTDTQREVTCT